MQHGDFYYPIPVNEPVLSYAPGSAEKLALKKVLLELKNTKVDVPMYIGNEEVRTGNLKPIHPPHEISATIGHFHAGESLTVDAQENVAGFDARFFCRATSQWFDNN